MRLSLSIAILIFLLPLSALSATWVGADFDGRPCRGGVENYGPFDYTSALNRQKYLPIVENYHFTPEVESLRKGKSGLLTGDIDYTLKAFPNHHRALWAMAKYNLKGGKLQFAPDVPRAECYFYRAINLYPKDGNTRLIFAIYQHRLKRFPQSEELYRQAIKMIPRSSEAHYNLGLLLVDMGKLKEAKKEAATAKKLGYPLKGLTNKIAAAEKKQAEKGSEDKADKEKPKDSSDAEINDASVDSEKK